MKTLRLNPTTLIFPENIAYMEVSHTANDLGNRELIGIKIHYAFGSVVQFVEMGTRRTSWKGGSSVEDNGWTWTYGFSLGDSGGLDMMYVWRRTEEILSEIHGRIAALQ